MSEEVNKQQPLNGDFNYGSQYFNVQATTLVSLEEHLTLHTENGPKRLNVKITADFNEIPKKYHEVFLNMMTAKYINTVSYGANPFSECKPPAKKRWWEFWKTQYVI
jgi:hypothetical protein